MSRDLRRLLPLVLVVGLFGCANAEIDGMTAGGHIMTGELECWLKLVFEEPPADIDATDVTVRFHSDALDEVAVFDWAFIAEHDVTSGKDFGSGNRPNLATNAQASPPVGEIVKVRFPLYAKRQLDVADGPIWLEAELWWGGEKQDTSKKDIQRLYRGEDDSSILPGY